MTELLGILTAAVTGRNQLCCCTVLPGQVLYLVRDRRQNKKIKSGLWLPLHFSSEPELVGEKTVDFKAWIDCGDLASLSSKGILIPKLALHIGNTRYVQLCFRKGGSRLLSKYLPPVQH